MTTMPNAHIAQVPGEKILNYLLNMSHPDGAGKATFFLAMGYRRTHWRVFQNDLEAVAQTGVIRAVVTNEHGTKYTIEGRLAVPRGDSAAVRTIWILDHGVQVPRLVTAYPVEGGDDE